MLDDDEIAGTVNARLVKANNYTNDKLSKERSEVNDYLQGLLPKPRTTGSSKYVSNDVFEAMESMNAQLLETFVGNRDTVGFTPTGPDDVETARIATELTNYCVHKQNNGFDIFSNVIHDGLSSRIGVVKVTWETSEAETEDTFEGSLGDLGSYFAENPDAEPGGADDTTVDETGMISTTLTKTIDTSRVLIDNVPPDEFIYSSGARTLDDADLLAHRTTKTFGELRSMGFDSDLIDELATGDWSKNSSEVFTRTRMEDQSGAFGRDGGTDDEMSAREIEVYECYTKLDMSGKGKPRKLWQIMLAGNKVLSKEEVKRHPFVAFVPLPRPHTLLGENYAARVIPTQNSKTMLMRSIIDHAAITTAPRWTVLRGSVADPRELLDSRAGGVVNLTKPDGIGLLPQPNLNPFVMNTLATLSADREAITGISALSTGLNKDAISNQNSAAMVEQLTSNGQVRQKVIARRFGEFDKALYLMVHQLQVENMTKEQTIEVAGNWIKVDPSALKVRQHVWLDVHLGYGEKDAEAKKYIGINTVLSNPAFARMYGPDQQHTVLSRALQATGVQDVGSVLLDPKTLPPAQPDPAQQLAMAKAQAEVKLLNAQADVKVQQLQLGAQKAQAEHQLKMLKLQNEAQEVQAALALKTRAQDFKETLDTAEFRVTAESAAASDKEQVLLQMPKV